MTLQKENSNSDDNLGGDDGENTGVNWDREK